MSMLILKIRFGRELWARLDAAAAFYEVPKADIVRMACRRANRQGALQYVVETENSVDTTYKGEVQEVALTPDIEAALKAVDESEKKWPPMIRATLDRYLASYEPLPKRDPKLADFDRQFADFEAKCETKWANLAETTARIEAANAAKRVKTKWKGWKK